MIEPICTSFSVIIVQNTWKQTKIFEPIDDLASQQKCKYKMQQSDSHKLYVMLAMVDIEKYRIIEI